LQYLEVIKYGLAPAAGKLRLPYFISQGHGMWGDFTPRFIFIEFFNSQEMISI